MIVKDAKCIAVYGRRGSGKSTLVKKLIEKRPRVIVFDPQREYGGRPGWTSAGSIHELAGAVARGWDAQRWKVAYVPPTESYALELHRLALFIWEAAYRYEKSGEKITLVIEEMNLSVPVTKLPQGQTGIIKLVLQGRHRGVELVGVTQRPALVSADFRGNVSETYVFPLAWADDQATILRLIGRDRQRELAALEDHTFLHLAGGRVSRGRNGPLRG